MHVSRDGIGLVTKKDSEDGYGSKTILFNTRMEAAICNMTEYLKPCTKSMYICYLRPKGDQRFHQDGCLSVDVSAAHNSKYKYHNKDFNLGTHCGYPVL